MDRQGDDIHSGESSCKKDREGRKSMSKWKVVSSEEWLLTGSILVEL